MRIAILSTRNARYHPNGRLLEAARGLGNEPFLLHPLRVLPAAGIPSSPSAPSDLPAVFLPRIGSTIQDHELAAVLHLEQSGVPALNGFTALAAARDKFISLCRLDAAGVPVPRTYLLTDSTQISRAVGELGGFPLIMKATRGRQGTSVYRVGDLPFARYILEHPPRPDPGLVVQEFIPSATRGDTRVVVVGDRAVASMKRIPRSGEFRANVHLRGKGVPWDPPAPWLEMARRAARTLGLQVAGVDLLEGPSGPLVLEVNTTPGFRELERVSGVDVAREIILQAVKIAHGR